MTFVLPPGLLLSALLCIGYAGLFHLWRGQTVRDLLVFWIASICGFALGQLLGLVIQLPLPQIGQVHVVEASLFAWLAMIGAHTLRIDDRIERRGID